MRYFQTKTIPVNVKDIDREQRIVKGYFASFDTLDHDGDIFRHGAFAKSIRENGPEGTKRIKHLFNHWDAVGVLQELKEDEQGLAYVSKIGRHTMGDDVLKMYEDEIITEHSVGFQTVSEHKESANIITEVKLWEGSCLDKWGANMNTPVVKSMESVNEMQRRIDKLTKALREGSYTDETFAQLEIQLKIIQQMMTTLAEESPGPEPDAIKLIENLKI